LASTPERETIANIIIDGYNVIGIQHGDVEAERERFVEALIGYRKRTGHDITVVFDGWRGGSLKPSRTTSGGVTVMYSAHGQTADALIKKIIAEDDKHWIVVSSDRDIQGRAWAGGSVPIESEQFLRKFQAGVPAGEYSPIEDDEDDAPARKGNPRKPSKKQKALDRALKKL
jgi:predicted RNA-binding protein with PIN domain